MFSGRQNWRAIIKIRNSKEYKVYSQSIQSCNMKNRDIYWRSYKIQETLYTGQWHLAPLQSRHLGTSHSSNCHRLPCCIFLNLMMVWNLFPFKGGFSFGKARSSRAPNLGCRGTESPGWFDVSPKTSGDMYKRERCNGEDVSYQLPIVVVFWIIQIASTEECSSLTQNLMQIQCSTRSVILNTMATQYACSLNSIYHAH